MSINSMTGYSNVRGTCALGRLNIEMRSVNGRFLDLLFRSPEDLRFTEPRVRETLQNALSRGKVEIRLDLKTDESALATQINKTVLQNILNLQKDIHAVVPEARPLSVSDLMQTPGVLLADTPDQEVLMQEVLTLLKQAIDQFIASREREGQALAKVLLKNCDQIEAVATDIQGRIGDILENINQKLQDRLKDALSAHLTDNSLLSKEEVNERIRQEVTLYAIRMDVEEEINRLLTHVKEIRRTLEKGGAVGRRLDFIIQELNREANTLGSKALAIEMTNASLQLKVVIEQMREQVQNLE